MSIKKLFENQKQGENLKKYLKNSSLESAASGLESAGHLSESIKKRDFFIPPTDYSDPKNFAKFGSAEKYYKDAFDFILGYYPYDGSGFEKTKFYNDLNIFEKYIFDEKYPKSTGYAIFGLDYAGAAAGSVNSGYFTSSNSNHVKIYGGPHSGTIYNAGKNRTNNLEFGGPSGSTVEFFFQKGTGQPSSGQSKRQVILDVHNGIGSGSLDYGRFKITMFSGSEDRFYVTMQSGGYAAATQSGFINVPVPTTGNLSITDGKWNHYAFSFDTAKTQPVLRFYVNGKCVDKIISTGSIGLVTGTLNATIGALQVSPSGVFAENQAGFGQLSGAIDEFRFWKKKRSDKDIGRNWFTTVDGGSNKHDANVSLGVYYKFNEGKTSKINTDRVVLDYSGRISNGRWVGYRNSYSRQTQSAINLLSASNVYELGDPIIRTENTRYQTTLESLEKNGSNYDKNNAAALINTLPLWLREDDENAENELPNLIQIVSTYFDSLHAQIGALSKIKHLEYVSGSLTGSLNEFPHNQRLLENYGTEAPELFENIDSFQKFLKRDEQINFDQDLSGIKNSIYKNIYNNLISIYKSKGTEKSIRNFIRCLGVGDDIIDVSVYANNTDYTLKENYKNILSNKKYIDFSGLQDLTSNYATVFQYYDSAKQSSSGLISRDSSDIEFPWTAECEVFFPDQSNKNNLEYSFPNVVTSSMFGYSTPSNTSRTSTNLTWDSALDDWGLTVIAVKAPSQFSKAYVANVDLKDAYFAVKNRAGDILLKTDTYRNVYDNEKWNFSLSVKPKKYPFVSGVLGAGMDGDTEFTLGLAGYNYNTGLLKNSFSKNLTLSYTSGSGQLTGSQRWFVGALRTNQTGALQLLSDVRISSYRYWLDYLPTGTIDLHAREADSFGRLHGSRNAYSFQGKNPGGYVPANETLALHWDFADITGSNSSGRFKVSDFSSGSFGDDESYVNDHLGSLSDILLRQHTGRGDLFSASYGKVAQKQYVFTQHPRLPDEVYSDDMVSVLQNDEEKFSRDTRPINYYFAVEKSLYKNISKRMLRLFASIAEYHNLVGEPVNKYRQDYKSLGKMREAFFRNAEVDFIDFDKYVRFYKWLDSSMNDMIVQLFPASSRFAENTRTVVESHMLERPKIRYGFTGDIKDVTPDLSGTIRNHTPCDFPGWRFAHAPINDQQNTNCFWWQNRTERENSVITAGSSAANNDRTKILRTRQTSVFSGGLVCVNAHLNSPVIGGINQAQNKIRDARDFTFFSSSLRAVTCDDDLTPAELQKNKVEFTVVKDGQNFTGNKLLPFTPISASAPGTGYFAGYRVDLQNNGLRDLDFANLHEDSNHAYGYSVPMQGPFTRDHVGGYISRHVRPLAKLGPVDADGVRPESWQMTFPSSGTGSIQTITTGSTPKGHYLRGLGARSPVNIENIKTSTTSSIRAYEGVARIGNFSENYEVVQTNDRFQVNVDLAANSSKYTGPNSGTMPTAFLSTPTRRAILPSGSSGSLDYATPRLRSDSKSTKSVIVQRFASPGSKQDSKQQFRDRTSDQLSSNNPLPFRNIVLRQPYLRNIGFRGPVSASSLAKFCGWGGFVSSSVTKNIGSQSQPLLSGSGDLSDLNKGRITRTEGSIDVTYSDLGAAQKAQRNTRKRIMLKSGSSEHPNYLNFKTGTLRDNAYVSRPVPDADRGSWFADLTGSDTTGKNLYNTYFVSGSRYPEDIDVALTSFDVLSATKASGLITIKTDNAGTLNNVVITITDTRGVTVSLTASSGASVGTGGWSDATNATYGVNGASSAGEIAQGLASIIEDGRTSGYIQVTAVADVSDASITLTQVNSGVTGNTTITTSDASAIEVNSSFTGGTNNPTVGFVGAAYTGSDNKIHYIWDEFRSIAPWSQTRVAQTRAGRYFAKNNVYEISPQIYNQEKSALKEEVILSNLDGTRRQLLNLSQTYIDIGGNAVSRPYLKRYREAPVTSRYKPIKHQINSLVGTAQQTSDDSTEAVLEYSYGNTMMGFAHRNLNRDIMGSRRYLAGKIKRPYEILRDHHTSMLPHEVDGARIIRNTVYPETIYPKEKYTYLSGTRGRLAFEQNFWKNDAEIDITSSHSTIISTFQTNDVVDTYRDEKYLRLNRTWPRFGDPKTIIEEKNILTTQFGGTSSMGYKLKGADQWVHFNLSLPTASAMLSKWPLDSFVYSDYLDSFDKISMLSSSVKGGVSLLPCGELMMPGYGSLIRYPVNSAYSGLYSNVRRSNAIHAQYVYGAPAIFRQGLSYAGAPMVGAIEYKTSSPSGDSIPANGELLPVVNPGNQTQMDASRYLQISDADAVDYYFYPYNSGQTNANTASVDPKGSPYIYYVGCYGFSSPSEYVETLVQAMTLAANNASAPFRFTFAQNSTNPQFLTITSSVNGTESDLGGGSSAQVIQGGNSLFPTYAGLTAQLYGGTSSIEPDHYLHNAPGGLDTRPAWTAAAHRKYVDGPKKGQKLVSQYPAYESYEEYAEEIKKVAQDHTIVPEFRISEHVSYYRNNEYSDFVPTVLELTGANKHNFDGTNNDFFERYSQTDKIEFLDSFMRNNSEDLSFNKYPRHFEIGSEATIKLLPYSGFYPVNRTLELATLFSQSYGSDGNAVPRFDGASGSSGNPDGPLFRSLLRPYFAPGIMYNSIKAGMAVDFPILRGNRTDPIAPVTAVNWLKAGTKSGRGALNILQGLKSGSINLGTGTIPGNQRRAPEGGWNFDDSVSGSALQKFYYSERLPFESILNPAPALLGTVSTGINPDGIILPDINEILFNDITGSITNEFVDDQLYKMATSNFLASVPSFFLKRKSSNNTNSGYMTKFVGTFRGDSWDSEPAPGQLRKVTTAPQTAYMMEVGLLKTSKFNMYNNPYAFGPPTATGSAFYSNSWEDLTQTTQRPIQQAWPKHRGEFAPYAPPYFYGASIARITYIPPQNEYGFGMEVTLQDIIGENAQNTYVQFINESGSYYDFDSGSFKSAQQAGYVSTTSTPLYKWNRAWQNRMDIDASIVIDNKFPVDNGTIKPKDLEKWVIMPKWECPILDFPSGSRSNHNNWSNVAGAYNFSSSVQIEDYSSPTFGMWHQYGVEPEAREGVFMFIRNVNQRDTELKLVGDPANGSPTGNYHNCFKIPKLVYDRLGDSAKVGSLAQLCGFDSDEIIDRGWDPSKAKRLGELESSDGEFIKTISEAIVAIPYYEVDGRPRIVTLKGDYDAVGPKVKEFRQSFAKYSFPPAIAEKLSRYLPPDYPNIPSYINPFGGDDLDRLLSIDGDVGLTAPIVYLMEHTAQLTKQDLADIWQGILPDLGKTVEKSFSSIDHYMPDEEGRSFSNEDPLSFPEIISKQIEIGGPTERDGVARVDMLDIAAGMDGFSLSKNGMHPEIKWLVFKVKQRGTPTYTDLIRDEINGYDSLSPSANPEVATNPAGESITDVVATDAYWKKRTYVDGQTLTYNWPYDYCSLIETAKINTKIGFRPHLDREVQEFNNNRSRFQQGSFDLSDEAIAAAVPRGVRPAPLAPNVVSEIATIPSTNQIDPSQFSPAFQATQVNQAALAQTQQVTSNNLPGRLNNNGNIGGY